MDRLSALLVVLVLAVAGLSIPQAAAANYGSIGSKVEVGNADFVPTLNTLPVAAEVLRRDIGATGDVSDDAYYLHFGTAGATSIAVGASFRLTCGVTFTTTCPSNAKEGTWVTAGQPDISSPTATNLGAFAPMVRYLEADGKPGWTAGDGLYVDLGGTPGTLEGGTTPDIRLIKPTGFSCTTCPVGQTVKTGDTDVVEATDGDRIHPLTTAFAPGAFTLHWFDGDGDFAVGTGDVFYLKGPAAPTAGTPTVHPDVGDARLGQLSLNPFTSVVDAFTLVAAGNPDHGRTFSVVTPQIAVTNTADPILANQHLLVHFADPDGVDDHIRVGDLFLYKAPGGSGGTLVTAKGTSVTAPGHGTGIDTTMDLTAQLRYYDLSPTGFSANDPIFIKRPGNTAGTIEVGDFRVTSSLGHAAGTQVKAGDSDINQPLVADANLVIKRYDNDGASWPVLKALSNAKIWEDAVGTGTAGIWDPSNDALYVSTGSVVGNGDIRLFHPGALPQGPTTAVACPGDADCGATIVAYSSVSVTGADSTFDAGSSEYIYDSQDLILGPGDRRVIAHPANAAFTAGSVVAAADADAAEKPLASGDALIVSYDAACATCTGFMRIGDAFLYGGAFGSRVTQSSTGFTPVLTQLAAGAIDIVRYNRGDLTSAADDTFYGTLTAAGVALQSNDIRLTANNPAAGTLLKTGDATYSQEVAGSSQFTRDGAGLETRLCHVDVDSRSGVNRHDPVYLQMDNAVFGTPFNADLTQVNAFDLRVTQYPASGTAQHPGGTIVLNGDSDLSSGQTTCATAPAGTSWHLRYFDQNGNGRFDSAGTGAGDDDVLYAVLQASQDNAPPPLFAIRLTGAGGATTPGSSTGGGTTPPSSPPSSPPSTPPTTPTEDPTPPEEPDTPLEIITAANAGLRQSLTVDRQGDDNVLGWDAQDGVSGYQIWRSNSSFVLVATISNATSYKDEGASANATYVVTAYVSQDGEDTGKYTDINNESVPGNPNLVGKSPDAGAEPKPKDGTTPGLPLVALLIVLGVAVLVRRRS